MIPTDADEPGGFHRRRARELAKGDGPSGALRVCGNDEFRWMEFQDGAVQSAMATDDPTRLVLRYSVWTLVALPLVRLPRSVLLLGLGGGAMARFARAHGVRNISVVERDPGVIEAARRWFDCGDDVASIHHGDARDFVAGHGQTHDVVLCDLFDGRGMAGFLDNAAFLDNLANTLNDRGLLVMNVAAQDRDEVDELLFAVRAAVPGGALGLFVPDTGNAIISAFASRPRPLPRARIERRAAVMERRTRVPFGRLVNALYANAGVRGGRLDFNGRARARQSRP